jgi:predicted patatin/cPLA2 family phospholipase
VTDARRSVLLATGQDLIRTGELKVWDRASDAPLRTAVASSCALPGVPPPVTVNERRWMDGDIGSKTDADAATDGSLLDAMVREMIEDSYDLIVARLPRAERLRLDRPGPSGRARLQ